MTNVSTSADSVWKIKKFDNWMLNCYSMVVKKLEQLKADFDSSGFALVVCFAGLFHMK